ncbi:glycoside hydrolase family 32 protein [Lentibacillus jeotgali]|uniref:glycoside hydrolase family 32 protein n=1 Tax=Lentibacillus jeotgali TaxID=558169 RepID=UPI0002627053|nr:sucrose-6-phosphate hydrolase [Lentibacillus jeotgali]
MKQNSSGLLGLAECRANDFKDVVTYDLYRLHYHLMPPVGLLNDPNGFVFFNGNYHLFYQWNPFGTEHGVKYWGHYVSPDLVHWESAPVALAPDQWYDKDGCYSGSAVVHQNKLYLFYTGNVKDESGRRSSYQCMAVSEDGLTFHKKGIVIDVPRGYTAHFRDPKVFYKHDQWHIVIGAQTESGNGAVVWYTSDDLMNWIYKGPIAGSGLNGLGAFGYMWECPDFFELAGKDILMISPQGLSPRGSLFNNIYQSGYIAGDMDYDTISYQHGAFTELDNGFDFYSPQTMLDHKGRRIMVGWMGVPENESAHPTTHYGWIHALTIPRELTWENGALKQRPVEEMALLRKREGHQTTFIFGDGELSPPSRPGIAFELDISFDSHDAELYSMTVGTSTSITFDKRKKTMTLKRRSFAEPGKFETRHCELCDLKHLQLFKDTSSIELFVNDGDAVFSARIFDDLQERDVIFQANNNLEMTVTHWALKKVCD